MEREIKGNIFAKIRVGDMEEHIVFPLQYASIQKRLQDMHAENPDNTVVRITALTEPSVLGTFVGKDIDLDELNFLATVMDSFDEDEYNQFVAACEHLNVSDMKTAINVAFNLRCYTFIPFGVSDYEAGEIYAMARDGQIRSDNDTDFEKLGREILQSENCFTTSKGRVYVDESDYIEMYNGQTFPAYCSHLAYVAAAVTCNNRTETLFLPDENLAIDKALKRLGAASLDECSVELKQLTPWVSDACFDGRYCKNLYEVNYKTQEVKDIIEAQEEKMTVVVVRPNLPAVKTQIGKSLDCLQAAVGGLIEPIYYLPDAVMVGNEEAKLIGMDALSACGGKRCNRKFDEGIVAGPFIICSEEMTEDGADFASLSDELCEKYIQQFSVPEHITQQEVQADTGMTFICY